MAKELLPIVISTAIWGPSLSGHKVLYQWGNSSAVAAIRRGSARYTIVMHLLHNPWLLLLTMMLILYVNILRGWSTPPQTTYPEITILCFVLFSQNTDASLLPTPLPAPLLQITIHLSYSDVVVDSKISPSMVFLHIKQSMTDTTREGAQVVLGLTGKEACPAKVLLPYVYGSQGCTTRPLFITADNHYLTQPLFRSALHPLLKLCAEWFNTHSF